MRLVGLPVDVVMYNLLMTAYKKARQWQHVVQVMQQMQASGVPADIVSYNILIDACGKAQQLARAPTHPVTFESRDAITACVVRASWRVTVADTRTSSSATSTRCTSRRAARSQVPSRAPTTHPTPKRLQTPPIIFVLGKNKLLIRKTQRI